MWKLNIFLLCLMLLSSVELVAQSEVELFPLESASVTHHRGQPIAGQTIQTTFYRGKTKRSYTYCTSRVPKTVLQQVIVRSNQRISPQEWKCWEGKKEIPLAWLNDSTFQFQLPLDRYKRYFSFYKSFQLIDKWISEYLPTQRQRLVIVPIVPISASETELEKQVNGIYQQAQIQLDVTLMPSFKTKVFTSNTQFSRPDSLPIYSGQMRLLRDQFFEQHPKCQPMPIICL